MKKHPVYALEMLSFIPFLQPVLDIPYAHHERWDGSGYPLGLKGSAIPRGARIFMVVDVWDALKSDRPYRPSWTTERTLAYIQEQSGKEFDPQVVEAFTMLVSKPKTVETQDLASPPFQTQNLAPLRYLNKFDQV